MNTISLEEFNQLPHKEQIAVHQEMKNNMGIAGILEAWNLSRNKYYYMVKKRNLNEDNQKKPKQTKKSTQLSTVDQVRPTSDQDVKKTIRRSLDTLKGDKVSLDITIQGSTQVVSTVLESITDMYNSPDTVFQVNMSVRQK